MTTIGDWFWVTIGMHRVARELGHLWGRLPVHVVARVVADSEMEDVELGRPAPELIAERIASLTREAFPNALPGIEGPQHLAAPPDHYLAQTLGGAGQVVVSATWGKVAVTYQKESWRDGWRLGRHLILLLEAGKEPRWSDWGLDPACPRDYARLYRVAEAGEWWPDGYWPPAPDWVTETEEWRKYMALDLPLMFMSPKTLDAPADGGPEEVEA